MLQLENLLEPIAGESPGGPSLRYDPVYDKIKEARREDLDVPQGGWQTALKTADWPLVAKLTSEAIATRSKDLQLAAWLAEAQLKRDGIAGLRAGLELTIGLVEGFWDHLHPELEDGDAELRASPLEWMGQYLDTAVRMAPLTRGGLSLLDYQTASAIGYEADAAGNSSRKAARDQAIENGKPTAEDFDREFDATPKAWYRELVEDVDGSLAAIESLDRICEERFDDVAPSFLKMRQALQEVRQTAGSLLARKLASDPDPVVVGSAPTIEAVLPPAGPETAAAGGAAHTAVAAVSAAPGTSGEADARIAAAARFLRTQSPADPAAYLLLRGYRWGELRAGAGEIDPAMLVAPPTELRARLKTLLLQEKWAELLATAEEVMAAPYGRGWLDLQRYVIFACAALGSEYDALALALRGTLRHLLQELPQLPAMAMMDDTPTANAETLDWLRAEGLLVAESAPTAEPVRPAPGRRDALDHAREKVRAGDPKAAVGMLMRAAASESCARERFMRRLQAAEILVDSGFEAVALPVLQEMSEQIETHGLESWEASPTIAQPLLLLHRCLMKVEGESSTTQELFLRVSRLDPLGAIHLSEIAPSPSDGADASGNGW